MTPRGFGKLFRLHTRPGVFSQEFRVTKVRACVGTVINGITFAVRDLEHIRGTLSRADPGSMGFGIY